MKEVDFILIFAVPLRWVTVPYNQPLYLYPLVSVMSSDFFCKQQVVSRGI